jgi:hypothetical protein
LRRLCGALLERLSVEKGSQLLDALPPGAATVLLRRVEK